MPFWTSDLCSCKSEYHIENDDMVGELTVPCTYHTEFENTLADNRLKNTSYNAIQEIVDMTDKSINFSFDFESGQITLHLHNFTETDLNNVNNLGLAVNIVEV